MADPLSIAAGLIGIIAATAQSTKALYTIVQSFQDQPRTVRRLQDELKGLNAALESLDALAGDGTTSFTPLELPLRQCGQACLEFKALVLKCTTHSDGTRPSVRDWVKLRYMDTDLRGFAEMLAGYKSTICVALADANLRSSTVTRQVLNDYKEMIKATTQDLEHHLEEITSKLQALPSLDPRPALTTKDRQWLDRERRSTEQCLEICAQGLQRIDKLKGRSDSEAAHEASNIPISVQELTLAEAMTVFALKKCNDELTLQLRALEERKRLDMRSNATWIDDQPVPTSQEEVQRLRCESDSTKQRLAILDKAAEQASSSAVHVLEDVSIGMDGVQKLITSHEQLFDVRRVTLGNRARQVIMSASNAALQEFLRSDKTERPFP